MCQDGAAKKILSIMLPESFEELNLVGSGWRHSENLPRARSICFWIALLDELVLTPRWFRRWPTSTRICPDIVAESEALEQSKEAEEEEEELLQDELDEAVEHEEDEELDRERIDETGSEFTESDAGIGS